MQGRMRINRVWISLKSCQGKRAGRRKVALTPFISSYQPFQSPAPPRSDRLSFRSSKNDLAGSQSLSRGSRTPDGSILEWRLSKISFKALTCFIGLGRRDFASSTPNELRRKPRWPCSAVLRRRKTQTPC